MVAMNLIDGMYAPHPIPKRPKPQPPNPNPDPNHAHHTTSHMYCCNPPTFISAVLMSLSIM